MNKKFKIAAIVVFLLVLSLPAAFVNLKKDAVSVRENRFLKAFPTLKKTDGELNDKFLSEFDDWFTDRHGFRNGLMNLNADLTYGIFRAAKAPEVVPGKNGWLFFSGNDSLELARGLDLLTAAEKKRIADTYSKLQGELEKKGIKMFFVIVPSKESIYPEYIKGDYCVTETMGDKFAEYLSQETSIPVLNLKNRFLEAKGKESQRLYFKTDTHWNYFGANIGYRAILERMRSIGMTDLEPHDLTFFEDRLLGDLMQRVTGDNKRYFEQTPQISQDRIFDELEADEELLKDYTDFHVDRILNPNGGNQKLLICGDSFSLSLFYLATRDFGETTYQWNYYPSNDILDKTKPDIVLIEITERLLPSMYNHFLKVIRDGDILKIEYYGNGADEKIWMPLWNELNGQDDLVWYEPERTEFGNWYMEVNLADHQNKGNICLDVYSGEVGNLELVAVYRNSFD